MGDLFVSQRSVIFFFRNFPTKKVVFFVLLVL